MPLSPGSHLGPYRVVGALGRGGMGEVYEATDTRLDRRVAIKVLPPELASDRERRERFEREAKAIAALNHPHICTLYDVGHENGTHFLVMEHLEGESLQDRLKTGALPLEQALRIAVQIGDALDKAHRQGITHRDLKPGNIFLHRSGGSTPAAARTADTPRPSRHTDHAVSAKLLDFGLAKLKDGAGGEHSTKLADSLTAKGTILGTVQYMAPEQLEGKEADPRSDIWAFGCVVYEMVTGTKAFDGNSPASVIASILEREPPSVSSVESSASSRLDHVIGTCLAKDPDDRWQTARDLLREVRRVEPTGGVAAGVASVPGKPSSRGRLATLAAGALLLLAVGWLVGSYQATSVSTERPPVLRFSVPLPPDVRLTTWWGSQVSVSPDGSTLGLIANDQLFLHDLGAGTTTPVPGTIGATSPFFSHDGQWIGFGREGGLQRVSTRGGAPVSIGPFPNYINASWTSDDDIFAASMDGIFRMSTSGGDPRPVLRAEPGERLRSPQYLPEHEAMIVTARQSGTFRSEGQVVFAHLETGERRVIVEDALDGRYVETGHVVYWQGGTLFAVPFAPERGETTGAAVPVVSGVSLGSGGAHVSVSGTGTLVYVEGSGRDRSLVWVDRSGRQEPIDAPPRSYDIPRLSPDGTRLAVGIQGADADVYVIGLDTGTLTRVTFDPASDTGPMWTPDGQRIVFGSTRQGGVRAPFSRAADGTGVAERLSPDVDGIPIGFSPDGAHLLVMELGERSWDVAMLSRDDGWARRPLLDEPFWETDPAISPDGAWLAYDSNESGRYEVYVRPFPNVSDGKWQVSQAGGRNPAWSPPGGELFFRNDQGMWVVRYEAGAAFSATTPDRLFDDRFSRPSGGRSWDVSPDGERFVMIVDDRVEGEVPFAGLDGVRVIANWFTELEGLMAVD